MAALTPLDDKFTVYIQKSCNPGPFLDPTKVKSLPEFFQERSVCQTTVDVIQAVVSAGFNFKETLDKVPICLVRGTGVNMEITENREDGRKIKHHCRLPVLDRKSKGEMVIAKFLANLQSCKEFLSPCKRECKECCMKQEKLTPSELRETEIKKEQSSPSLKKQPKSQFIVYCRRNCKVGLLLDPNKIKRLSTSFSGSIPKIIKEVVPAIVLCGYNPIDVLKHVPSSQGGCILIKVKIGKLNRMCLVGNVDCSVKFWSFIRKLCSAFGMCENFFSGKPPKKSSCKKCRNTDFEADYYSSDDDDFQDLSGYKEIVKSIEKRKRTSVDKCTSAKKLKSSDDCHQLQPRELKVVIKKLPQDIVSCYQQGKRVKQGYLHGKKVNIVIPGLEKSPRKRLFSEASTLLPSPDHGKDDEAENMLNMSVNQEKTLPDHGETAIEEVSVENDVDDYMLETFLDQGVEDNNAELKALKEMSEKIEERNPLQGLFEKPEEQGDCRGTEEKSQEDESFDQYPSSFDASQLFSPASFFGDVLDPTEMNSSPNKIELRRVKSEPQERDSTNEYYTGNEVGSENNKTDKEGEKSKELQAVKSNTIALEQAADSCTKTKAIELEQGVESTASAVDERPINDANDDKNDKADLPISGDSTNDPMLIEQANNDVPISPKTIIITEDGNSMTTEHSKCHTSSSPTVLPLSSQSSAPLSTLTSQSNNFINLSFPEVLKSLEITTKSFAEKSVNTTLPQASSGRQMSVSTNNAVQSFSSVTTPQLQSLPVDNVRMNALTSTFGTPQLPVPLSIFSWSGMPALPGIVSNSSFLVSNGTNDTQTTPVVSLPGNPAKNSGLATQNVISGILSPRLHHLPLTGNFSTYSSHSSNHGTNNIPGTNFPSVLLAGNFVPGSSGASQHHLKAYVTSSLRTYGTNSLRNSNQQQQQVDFNRNNFSNSQVNNAGILLVHKAIQKARDMQNKSLTNISSPSGSQNMYPFLGQQLPQPLVTSPANAGLCSPYSYGGLTNNFMANSLYPLQSPRYHPAFTNGSQTSQHLTGNNHSQLPVTKYTISSTTGLPAISQPYSVTNHPSRELVNARHYFPTLPSQAAIGMNPSTVSEVQTMSSYPSVRQPINQFIPLTTLPFDTRQVQSSTNVLPRSSGSVVPQVQISTNVLPRSSASAVPLVQSSTNVLPRSSASVVPQVQSSTNVLPRSSASAVPQVQSSTNVLPRSSASVVPQVQSSTNVLPRSSTCAVPQVQSSTNALTRSSASAVPLVQSSTNVLPRSSASAVPLVQSSTNVLPRSSASAVPLVQSSTNVLPRSSTCAVPPVQRSTNVLPRSSASAVPLVQSSTNVLPRSSAYAVPQVQSSTFESDNITSDPITCNNKLGKAELSDRIRELVARNPLAKTILIFMKRCQILPKEKYFILRKKIEQMLQTRLQRLAISQKDINDLEELVGVEIKNEPIFQDLIKQITGELLLKDSNSVYHTISNSENQGLQSTSNTTQVSGMVQSVIDVQGTILNRSNSENQGLQSTSNTTQVSGMVQSVIDVQGTTAVTQSSGRGQMETVTLSAQTQIDPVDVSGTEISGNGLECNNASSMSDEDDDVVIIDQPKEKQSIPTSDAASNAVSSKRQLNSLLPKLSVKVMEIEGTMVLLWDLPDQSASELIKEYEVYATQLEVNKSLTKDLMRSMTWNKIGIVSALPTPMAITLTNLVEGFKSYMTVRAVGADDSVGPLSDLCEVLGS